MRHKIFARNDITNVKSKEHLEDSFDNIKMNIKTLYKTFGCLSDCTIFSIYVNNISVSMKIREIFRVIHSVRIEEVVTILYMQKCRVSGVSEDETVCLQVYADVCELRHCNEELRCEEDPEVASALWRK